MTGQTTKLRFGVIGQGHIGKRHAEMIRRNPFCELIAVCDVLSPEKTDSTGIAESYYSSAQEMLEAHPEIDIVNVCTPNGLHAEHALSALKHHKHVVCEKPMALSTKDCQAIIDQSKLVGKEVFCVMQNRFSPPSVWLKELVDSQTLGEIHLVQLNCYWNRDDRYYKKDGWKGKQSLDGGTLFTQFSHFIDLLYWIFGDLKNISGRFKDFNHKDLTDFEDSGLVTFDLVNNNGMGCINYSTAVHDTNLESSITVIGSLGSVKVGGQYMDKVEYCHIKDYTLPTLQPTSPANDYGTHKGSANNHHFVIQNVVETLTGISQASTKAIEGLHVVDIIARIYSLRNSNLKS